MIADHPGRNSVHRCSLCGDWRLSRLHELCIPCELSRDNSMRVFSAGLDSFMPARTSKPSRSPPHLRLVWSAPRDRRQEHG